MVTFFIDNLLRNEKLDMTELRFKTHKIFENDNHIEDYKNVFSYMKGCCQLNYKLSLNESLFENEQNILNSINNSVDRVEPLSYPVTLFHGFELLTKYNENNWKVGQTISIPGFLSKTPSLDVATKFASKFNSLHVKYLVVKYQVNSKHINLDIHDKENEEFEYLTHSNEKLMLTDVVKKFNFPFMNVFYICEKIN